MRILGIDPGEKTGGIALVEDGLCTRHEALRGADWLEVADLITYHVRTLAPDYVYIERYVPHGGSVTIGVAQCVGAAVYGAHMLRGGAKIRLITNGEWRNWAVRRELCAIADGCELPPGWNHPDEHVQDAVRIAYYGFYCASTRREGEEK